MTIIYDTRTRRILGPYAGVIAGDVYYVSTSGVDTANGLSPSTAFLTIEHALLQVTDNHDDYIFVLPGYYSPTGDKIQMTTIGVHLIGLNINPFSGDCGSPVLYRPGAAAEPVLEISDGTAENGGENEISGFTFAANNDDALFQPAVEINGDAGGCGGAFNWIHNCRFPGWWETVGIMLWGGGWNVIGPNNQFEELTSGVVCGSRVFGMENTTIMGSIFRGCTYGVDAGNNAYTNHDLWIGPHNEFCRSRTKAMTYAVRWGNGMDYVFVKRNDICLNHDKAFGEIGPPEAVLANPAALVADPYYSYAACNCFGDGVAFS